MSALNQTTPAVLKNRGVPVSFIVLNKDDEGRWTRSYTDGGGPVTEVVHLQMTNDVLAAIEDDVTGWGSLDAWQKDLQEHPFKALGKTIALCRDWYTPADLPDVRRAGKAMLDAEIDVYSAAVGGAFMLANGLAPEQVGKTLADGVKASAAQKKRAMDRVTEQLDKAAREQELLEAHEEDLAAAPDTPTPPRSGTRGKAGAKRGAASDGPSTSSGD